MLGMEDHIGSLTPGKQADLVMIRADAINMQPLHDPAAAVVMQASIANIDRVMVAGRWMVRTGRLMVTDLDRRLACLRHSGERIVHAMDLRAVAT